MEKKIMGWKTKGMNRDFSVSAFNPEFSFENRNLRLSTNEGNTLMSWVNERGTMGVGVRINTQPWKAERPITAYSIDGTPIGTAIINHQLVLFTTISPEPDDNTGDCIYVFNPPEEENNALVMKGKILYSGNLGFNTNNPIETLVDYESSLIQKVYWVDGKNQARVINIAASNEKLKLWNTDNTHPVPDTRFDFVPTVQMQETFSVEKLSSSSGIFESGTIQYCFTYVNKYGQETNIISVSALNYLSPVDRGARPDEKVNNSFIIKIENPDTSFDYIRIYSLHRTSLDLEPKTRRIVTLSTTGKKVSETVNGTTTETNIVTYTDNGTVGESVDPTELIFIGGKEVIAQTLASKNDTLFLGNITQKDTYVGEIQEYFDNPNNDVTITFHNGETVTFQNGETEESITYNKKEITLDTTDGIYANTHMLNKSLREITTFKGGDTYRFGFQLQKATGEWSEPIYLKDQKNDKYPRHGNVDSEDGLVDTYKVNLVYAESTLNFSDSTTFGNDFFNTYKRIRPVIVYPTIADREVLCQGVLNPTVFNAIDRKEKQPFAQASWYFRPYTLAEDPEGVDNSVCVQVNPETEPVASDIQQHETVYITLLKGPKEQISAILKQGYWRWYNSELKRKKMGFDGGIIITEDYSDDNTHDMICAFIKKDGAYPGTMWPIEGASGYAVCLSSNTPANSFNIYSGLRKTPDNLYYYEQESTESPETYLFDFKFRYDGTVPDWIQNTANDAQGLWEYRIFFTSTAINSTEYGIVTEGSKVEFTHYSSLYSLSNNPEYREHYKQIEIQGAENMYTSPFSTSIIDDVESNTQFFVDQSIVTLNSPEIEFNTEVQSYGTEGLKLRIIGAIPITASASAHNITSSTMLETGLNLSNVDTHIFGNGELKLNTYYKNISEFGAKRLVSDYLWNDVVVKERAQIPEGATLPNDKIETYENTNTFLVFPWQRSSSLNNDWRSTDVASSILKIKKESNILYSYFTRYLVEGDADIGTNNLGNIVHRAVSFIDYSKVGVQMHLTENEQVYNIKLPSQKGDSSTLEASEISYYPNIDKVLYNENGYKPTIAAFYEELKDINGPIAMKYKSSSHAVIGVNSDNVGIPIMPYTFYFDDTEVQNRYGVGPRGIVLSGRYNGGSTPGRTYWGDLLKFTQNEGPSYHYLFPSSKNTEIPEEQETWKAPYKYDFLWLGELYKEPDANSMFGGSHKEALINNNWLVAGDTVDLDSTVTLDWTQGDTYYQRYDCLKTYAFTPDDPNQLVEILSFMCETHVNIDGRYDRNRGQINNYNMSPVNFNLLNPIYSQRDNFFVGKKTDVTDEEQLHYPNWITYSKTKESGADVDLWTNVTLGSVLELDGEKGEISAIRRYNDQLIAFQDNGISQILYDENVQISSTEGVPIEIANSGKIQGKRYITDTIGCSNKWSIATTPAGLYFMDNNDKSIYLFNGQLNNLSTSLGMNSWCKKNMPSATVKWTPDNPQNFVSYYDKLNQEVLFINSEEALAYNEKFNTFTSFYSYGESPYFCNLDDTGVWINKSRATGEGDDYKLWAHQKGAYSNFFDRTEPYSMTLVGNPEPQRDKIFTNLEFRATVETDGTETDNKFTPLLPFDSLETWDEYQHGIATLQNKNGNDAMRHHTSDKTASLKRKFRIWRCDIPRDNAEVNSSTEAAMGISRFKKRLNDRMRNPWLYLKLQKNAGTDDYLPKTEIHDMVMTYFC